MLDATSARNAFRLVMGLMRRMAERQGLRLEKSHRRDPHAIGYGRWQLVDVAGELVRGDVDHGQGLTLDEVERWLTR